MKDSIGTAVAIFMLALTTVVITSFIMVNLNVTKAQKFHSQVIANVEDSDFSTSVINQIKTEASQNGYDNLDIAILNSADGSKSAKVTLDYTYTIPIVGIDLNYDLVGYAR